MNNYKVVQSFWSKPFSETLRNKTTKLGNWLNSEMFFISHSLSLLNLKKYYGNVELITDDLGAKILIDYLRLPYDHINLNLNELHNYNPGLWALGKIKAYSLQNTPFIHVDNDVFIWKEFDSDFLLSPLVCQNIDLSHNFYKEITEQIKVNKLYVPKEMKTYVKNNANIGGYGGMNAGVIGGSHFNFFKKFSSIAFDIVNKNHHALDNISLNKFNTFYEQALYYCLSLEEGLLVQTLFDNPETVEFETLKIENVPNSFYIHPVSKTKENIQINEFIYITFRTNYPEYFDRIQRLVKENYYGIF